MKEYARSIAEEMLSGLRSIYGNRLRGLYVYGSYAREEEDSQSDLDILVILDDYSDYWEEIQRTSHLVADLSLRFGVSLCPIPIREADWLEDDSPFLKNIRREGVPV
jgi:predicted nucleotidyltransferase